MDKCVSIIVPTISRGMPKVLKIVRDWHQRSKSSLEIIIVRNVRPAAKARNEGAIKATSDILLFIDDDVAFDPNSLNEIINKLLDDEKIVVGSCVEQIYFKSKYVSTGLMGIRKKDFIGIGGFDERLHGYEDFEFSIRAVQKGYKLLSLPLRIEHYNPRSFARFIVRSLRYELSGTLMAIEYAPYFRHTTIRWFFPLLIDTSKHPSLFISPKYRVIRSQITRILVRILGFYYWSLKKVLFSLYRTLRRFG